MLDVYSLELMDLGFRVSSMPYSDTYTAMQTGVVAGLAGCTSQMNYLSFRDIITAFYDYRYNQEATMIMFSQKTWDKLLPEDQETITKIVDEICAEAAVQAEEVCNEYMEKMAEEGIEVFTFTEEELAAFAESSGTMCGPSWKPTIPTAGCSRCRTASPPDRAGTFFVGNGRGAAAERGAAPLGKDGIW